MKDGTLKNNYHITPSYEQPASWWQTWLNTMFCPECGAGQMGNYPNIADPCPECGRQEGDSTVEIARLVPLDVWYNPWTWKTYRLEIRKK